MDEITLSTQVPATEGDPTSLPTEKYAEAVEEWSGGKIKMEISYANSLVPSADAISAIADGIMDWGYVSPVYEPARYPASNELITVSTVARPTPVVGAMQTTAVMAETTYATSDIPDELEASGLKILVPAFPTDSAVINCAKPRSTKEALKGAQIRVASEVHSKAAEKLGMTPVTLAYSEAYEALQRGTVDCTLGLLLAADLSGFVPEAPFVTVDPDAGFATATNPVAFGLDRWEDLPLAAQQLLYDKSRVFIEEYFYTLFDSNQNALKNVESAGGSVSEFDAAAEEELIAFNESLLDVVAESDGLADGDAFVTAATEAADTWLATIEELGYEDVSYADFNEWYVRDEFDIKPYMDRLWDDVLVAQRPE